MGKNLYNKIWDMHKVKDLPTGQIQIFIGLHLVHEVTSPQAFQMLRERGLKVKYPEQTFATIDHIIPTQNQIIRPYADNQAELMAQALEKNTKEFDITFFNVQSKRQGVIHVIAPELGLVQPGMTIVCGDSHTSTHGAFGSIALGIGTSQVRDVLATQTLAINKLKVRKIQVNGGLRKGVTAKDVILFIIRKLGVKGGLGYAYEYCGEAIENMSIEERMTICNMTIEGGARCGYINPDEKTFEYLKGREYAPKQGEFEKAVEFWNSISSDENSEYDDIVTIDASEIEPTVTWGITPGQNIGISETIPVIDDIPEDEKKTAKRAYKYMNIIPGKPIKGTKIDVAFIGSCTNGRLSDFIQAANILKGKKVAPGISAIAVPGSHNVKKEAEKLGLDIIFTSAGFDWREPGCSMCLAMNPDKLKGNEVCASTSNRNFIGRQGSPTGRTILMSPVMVAAAAIEGKVVDVRDYL